MATGKLFDFLPSVYHPEGNGGPRIRADYLRENDMIETRNTVLGSAIFILTKISNLCLSVTQIPPVVSDIFAMYFVPFC